jgi:hypothetical protein
MTQSTGGLVNAAHIPAYRGERCRSTVPVNCQWRRLLPRSFQG